MDGIIVDVYDADLFAKSLSRALSCINNFDKSKIVLTASQRYSQNQLVSLMSLYTIQCFEKYYHHRCQLFIGKYFYPSGLQSS